MTSKIREALFLSKSKYLAGLQCPKLLWTHYRDKDKFPPTDLHTQALFDQGHQVTKLSQVLFPGGVEIQGAEDFEKIIQDSHTALSLNKPLFEPGFRYKNTYARADILKPNKNGSWNLFEVKSSTSVKYINYEDVAFQKYCYEGAGLKINKTYLVYINNQYVKNGPIDPEALLVQEDITDVVQGLVGSVENKIDQMMKILKQEKCPEVKIGLQCDDPYECPLKSFCWDFLPENSVFILNRIHKKKAFELIESGILDLKDVAKDYPLSASQRIQRECHTKNKVHTDPPAIKSFIDRLEFPIYFLDFETVGPAVPFYDSSRPYQQVPFQFSLHILSDWNKKAAHHAFLADNKDDPRPGLLSKLKALIGDKGNVLSYNMSFELARLRESVAVYLEYEKWFKGIESRFMDLIVPFRGFDYYSPKQMGRTSIKNVFPALTDGSYEGLEIGDGGAASLEFGRVMFSDGISKEDKQRVLKNLEIYCKLDTQAMIDILKILKTVVKNEIKA